MHLPCGADEVIWRVLLKHSLHRVHIIASEAPVATCFKVAQGQAKLEPNEICATARGHPSGHEFMATTGTLVIEKLAEPAKA